MATHCGNGSDGSSFYETNAISSDECRLARKIVQSSLDTLVTLLSRHVVTRYFGVSPLKRKPNSIRVIQLSFVARTMAVTP